MKTLMRAAVILFATILARDAFASDLCQDPRIPPPGAAGRCETYSLRYADGAAETDVQLAKVFRREARYTDVIIDEYEHYLRRPDGEIVSLGRFPQQQGFHAEYFALRKLRIDPAYANGMMRIDFDIFFDQRLERVRDPDRGDRYCMTYRMKPPFQGNFQDCDGSSTPIGNVDYAAGTVTWDEANKRACSEALPDPDRHCFGGLISNLIERNADGGISYIATVRQQSFWGWTFSIYRIDAAGGAVALLKKTSDSQQANEWSHGQGRPATWTDSLGRFGWVPFGAPFLLFGLLAWRARRRRRQIGVPLEQSGRSA